MSLLLLDNIINTLKLSSDLVALSNKGATCDPTRPDLRFQPQNRTNTDTVGNTDSLVGYTVYADYVFSLEATNLASSSCWQLCTDLDNFKFDYLKNDADGWNCAFDSEPCPDEGFHGSLYKPWSSCRIDSRILSSHGTLVLTNLWCWRLVRILIYLGISAIHRLFPLIRLVMGEAM